MKISYAILKAAISYSLFKPCIHTYLLTHIKSHLITIDSKDWEFVVSLPLAQWKKGKPY